MIFSGSAAMQPGKMNLPFAATAFPIAASDHAWALSRKPQVLTTTTSAPSCPRVSSYPSARRRVMMRSLSTSAFGQPSETKLTFGARPLSEFRFSICEGLPEHESGSKRSSGGRAHLRRATAATKCKAGAKTAPPELNLAFCHCVGRVAEWFKAAVLKTARGFTLPRGFESHPFRQRLGVAKRYNCTILLSFEPLAPGSRPTGQGE